MADVCFVTGASSPVGRAVVEHMAGHGYRVGFLVLGSEDQVAGLEAGTGTAGASAAGSDEVATALEGLVARVGPPRVLVLCDEAYLSARATDTTWSSTDTLMRQMFFPRLEAIRALVPFLASTGHGRIVNVIHRDWLGWSQVAAYSSVNGALVSLTRTLAWELAKERITVNAVALGVVCRPGEAEFHGKPVERWLATQPIRRIATPPDAAKAVAFLADPRSDFISGQVLYFDGGRCIYSSLTA